jgi:hypothetical protein
MFSICGMLVIKYFCVLFIFIATTSTLFVGGQKSIRTYWRNYFEQTDGIIWVIDSVDQFRLEECRRQLRDLLSQEVSICNINELIND